MAVVNSGRGQTFQVCVTPQNSDLNAGAFAGLTYKDVCCLVETPEMAAEANIISENCIDGTKIRLVGADEDGDFEVQWYYDSECDGQDDLRGFGLAKSNNAYAVRIVYSDGVSGVTTPTTYYARVIFSGYTKAGIGIDDVQTESVTGSIVQGPIFVAPASI